jgi:hypothetical protein
MRDFDRARRSHFDNRHYFELLREWEATDGAAAVKATAQRAGDEAAAVITFDDAAASLR